MIGEEADEEVSLTYLPGAFFDEFFEVCAPEPTAALVAAVLARYNLLHPVEREHR